MPNNDTLADRLAEIDRLTLQHRHALVDLKTERTQVMSALREQHRITRKAVATRYGSIGELGKAVHAGRKAKSMRQEDLAALMGLTRTSISNIENGKQDIPYSGYLKLRRILDI